MQKPSFFPNLAINRPVTIIVSLLAIIVVGGIAYQLIPIELFPSGMSQNSLGVWIQYENANPEEVAEQIARPIEEQLRTISGIRNIETYSQQNGCWAWLEFSPKTDMTVAYDQLRDRMERARAMLPDDFDRYFLRRFGPGDIPIIFLTLSFPDHVQDPYYVAETYFKTPLERVDGVGNVELWGADQKVIQILIDENKVKGFNLDMFAVINELRNDNFALSSGWIYEGEKKFIVRSVARFESVEDIKSLPINKLGVTVGDIADVVYEPLKKTWNQRVNRKSAILVGINKESLANTVALSNQVRDIVTREVAENPKLKGADVNMLFVQGDFIVDAINNLKSTALWGGVFAILILLFFLRNIRMTLIMMFAIPLSILISLVVIYFIGWTMNLITMMGLMISIGMVIDNGIVVLENIYHKRSDGESPMSASLWGTSEVNLAIILATLTTIGVFVPMIFTDDGGSNFNFFMQRVGLPVIFSLLASLFVALVLIPLATSRFSTDKLAPEHRLITWGKSRYDWLLRGFLDRRMDSVMFVLFILVVTFGVLPQFIPQADMDGGDIADVQLMFDLPRHLTTEETDEFLTQVEDTIYAYEESYGVRAVETSFRPGFGRIRLYLKPSAHLQWYHTIYFGARGLLGLEDSRPMAKDLVLADLKSRLPEKPGVKFRTSWRSGGDDDGSVQILLYGDDTGKLVALSEEVKRRMNKLDGVLSVESDREDGADEIQISLDRQLLNRNGINLDQVGYSLMYAVRGIQLPRFQARDKEIDVRIQLKEEHRENLEQLKNMTFMNSEGKAVPLSAIASFNFEKGFGEVKRANGKTFLAVKAQTTNKDLGRISKQVDEIMAGFEMPFGYSWKKGSRFDNFDDQNSSMVQAVILAIALVYILMAVLFESFILPLCILLAIPLAMFGANLALAVTRTAQDMMAGIGFVILIGVVVNNGIVLVDMIIRRRKEGFGRREAILDAGQNRFRPILMTSFTTIGGLIPMALGSGALFGIPYAPMGRVLIGGMLTSTFLTLVVVPVFYTLFDDLAEFSRQVPGWFSKRAKEAASPAAGAAGVLKD